MKLRTISHLNGTKKRLQWITSNCVFNIRKVTSPFPLVLGSLSIARKSRLVKIKSIWKVKPLSEKWNHLSEKWNHLSEKWNHLSEKWNHLSEKWNHSRKHYFYLPWWFSRKNWNLIIPRVIKFNCLGFGTSQLFRLDCRRHHGICVHLFYRFNTFHLRSLGCQESIRVWTCDCFLNLLLNCLSI